MYKRRHSTFGRSSSKFIKRYNKFLIKEECLRRGVDPKDLLVAPEKVIDVNVYIMLTKYGQMNREVGTSLRDMYVDDMLKYASRYKDEEKKRSENCNLLKMANEL
mgnify:CR=1 FL=1